MTKLRRTPLIALALCLLLAIFLLAYPLYVIRPFRYQGAHELSLALIILRFRSVLNIVLAGSALALLVWFFRTRPRLLSKASAVLCTLLIVTCGILSRVNVYEMMFKPVARATFSPASQAKLDGDEQVIAVKVKSAPRAYPIRSISYHHIVNDVLADEPIVATY